MGARLFKEIKKLSDWTDAVDILDAAMADFYDTAAGTALKSIVIESTTRTIDANGELSNSWAMFANVSDVLVTGLGVDENEQQAERIEAIDNREFDMPYVGGVLEGMRIVYEGGYYYISNVVYDETESYRTVCTAHKNLTQDVKP